MVEEGESTLSQRRHTIRLLLPLRFRLSLRTGFIERQSSIHCAEMRLIKPIHNAMMAVQPHHRDYDPRIAMRLT